MKDQSTRTRIARLATSRCPVHGTGMAQIGRFADDGFTLVGCGRKDCGIVGRADSPDGPVHLLPQWQPLLMGDWEALQRECADARVRP